MHGFLIIGNNTEKQKLKVQELSDSLEAVIIPYKLERVEDVRNLTSFVRLSLKEKTIIFIEDIEKATIETLNAFLKNLEEPQEKLFFILTASSIKKVLSTIVSRCQVINLEKNNDNNVDFSKVIKFYEMTVGEKLMYVDKFKERPVAISLVEDLISYLHSLIHSNEQLNKKILENIKIANKTYKNLKANGNINLQLTYLVSNLV